MCDDELSESRKSDQDYIDRITKDFIKLFDTNKFPFDSTLLDQIIQKLKPDVSKNQISYSHTLRTIFISVQL